MNKPDSLVAGTVTNNPVNMQPSADAGANALHTDIEAAEPFDDMTGPLGDPIPDRTLGDAPETMPTIRIQAETRQDTTTKAAIAQVKLLPLVKALVEAERKTDRIWKDEYKPTQKAAEKGDREAKIRHATADIDFTEAVAAKEKALKSLLDAAAEVWP